MKAQRISQQVKVKIGTIEFSVAPLKFEERTLVQAELVKAERNQDPLGLVVAARLAMKYAIKAQKGITYEDGEPFELQFDEHGYLAEDTLEELYLSDSDEKLKMLCIAMARKGFPTVPLDEKGKPIKGIKIEKTGKQSPPK